MSHLDDDALAAIVLGDGTDADVAHATACPQCAEALADFERVTGSLSALGANAPRGPLEAPPAHVWDAIAAQTGTAQAGTAQAGAAPAGATDELAARRTQRNTSWWALTAAAAVGVVVGGFGVSLATGPTQEASELVASAPLAQLQTESSAGTADVEVREDGTRVLVVETDYEDLTDAYLEVWLIDQNIEGMVSLGHLTGERTEFVLPEGFDITLYPIVDISIEPVDGNPAHSGDSVTRGVLDL